jgi:VanZ family protein
LKISYDFGMSSLDMQSAKAAREALRSPRGLPLPWILAVAYLLVIAYASLQPFTGWWTPPEEIRRFLTAPWPRYITLEDVLINIGAYVPLGFLLARALMRRTGNPSAVLLAALLATLLSLAMETVQMFMPSRIASNVDVLTNGLGGLIGALAAPLFSRTRLLGLRLARWRRTWFVYGSGADMGLVLLCLWLVTQLHPTAQLFGTGNVRGTFELPVLFIHTPALLLTAEAAVAGFNVLGIGLIVVALTREPKRRGPVLAALLGAGFAAKAYTALAVAKSAGPLAWLTPGVALGIVVAGALLYGLSFLPRRAQWMIGSLSLAAAIVTINVAPDNPYQTVPVQLLAGPTHFLSFSGIVRALSELWPFLAVAYTGAAAYGIWWQR